MDDKDFHFSMFAAGLIILLAASFIVYRELVPSEGIGLAVYTLAVLLGLSVHLVERYFSKPNDVIVNAASVLLVFLPLKQEPIASSLTYGVIVSWAAIVLLAAITASLLFDTSGMNSRRNAISFIFKDIAVRLGNGRLLFGYPIFALLFYFGKTDDPFFIAAALVSLGHLVLEKRHLPNFRKYLRLSTPAEGIILGTTGRDGYHGKLPIGSAVPASVVFAHAGKVAVGTVVSFHRTLDDLRIEFVATSEGLSEDAEKPRDGSFYGCPTDDENEVLGYVVAGTKVSELRFVPVDGRSISVGNIVEVIEQGRSIYYQIQDGEISRDLYDTNNEANFISASAAQLGTYNAGERVFERFDWVPRATAIVQKPTEFPVLNGQDGEYLLGEFPGTEFSVYLNIREAITYHCAVLGVTGTGKSVFCRELIRETASSAIKYICVDITNEYAVKLGDQIQSIVAGEPRTRITDSIEFLIAERRKFANQQNHHRIAKESESILQDFKQQIEAFVSGDKCIGLVEFSDLSGTIQSYEYLKWFFQALMDLARDAAFEETVICVVLEEAHTIVPEWNFVADGDRSVSMLLNSISQIALQGRKYGVGLLVIAQRTANVSKTILTQCNTVIAFQQFDKTSADFLESFVGGDAGRILPNLKPRTAIATGKGLRSSTPVIFKVRDISEKPAEEAGAKAAESSDFAPMSNHAEQVLQGEEDDGGERG